MTEEALMEEINELREKLEQAESEFESYKRETKDMEDFLEAEATKKEGQIRKLKEEAILKEKNFKLLKVEVTQLLSETASLKGQLAQGSERQQLSEAMGRLQDENQDLRKANGQLSKELQKQRQGLWQLEKERKDLQQQWQTKFKRLTEQQSENAVYIAQLESDKNSLAGQLAQVEKRKVLLSQVKTQSPVLERKNSKKQAAFKMQNFDRQRERYEERLRKLEEQNSRNEKTIKEQKFRIQGLLQEKEQLKMNNRNSRATLVPSASVYKLSVAKEESEWDSARMRYSCLLLTKYHYVSPFLEIHEDKNVIEIYKSTRTGCFQKSVGSTRHRFDQIGFEDEDVINPLVARILESQSANHHSIIIYGVRRSAKKYLMAKILVKLKQFLHDKLDHYGESEAVFLRRSTEEEKNFSFKATDKETVLELIDMVIAMGHKKQRKFDKYRVFSPRKPPSKPKVRYFSLRLNDFSLQLGTSSFTNLVYRQKASSSNMLNNIFYTKLLDILQSLISQKHLLLVINPIVDLYEDCKNTLSATLYKGGAVSREEEEFKDWRGSPVREELNNATKKKVEILQRQNQQTSIKIKRLEEEILHYRARFDELECRLKNLLNTHSGQNSYLKKSPVTLSYQKLLKFVHSVQGRTSLNSSLSGANSGNLKVMAIEKGYDSSEEVL